MINTINWIQKGHYVAIILFSVVMHVFGIDLTSRLGKTAILEKFVDRKIKLPNESK